MADDGNGVKVTDKSEGITESDEKHDKKFTGGSAGIEKSAES